MRDITDLPHDLFLLILSYLSPRTCVLCRSVSRRWHAAFTSEVASLLLLRWNFPRCRELRLASLAATLSPSPVLSSNLKAELVDFEDGIRPWSSTFARVARRYHFLNRGIPRAVEKLDLAASKQDDGTAFSFWGVAPWNRFLRMGDKTASFHYDDPVWSYSQEDGVLVYPVADASSKQCDGFVYHVFDPSTGQRVPVPFDVRSKHIRRVRLSQGVLIIEWAEALPYHQLNDREVVHRHFVTAFDVVRKPFACRRRLVPLENPKHGHRWTWHIEFRSEWKLHFLGLPLNRSDRFFSAHTATHYAVYFWQPNRSLYQDDPIEQLAVWDISSPSPYRPSEDPRGIKRPSIGRTPSSPPTGLWNGHRSPGITRIYQSAEPNACPERLETTPSSDASFGPRVVRRMAWRELDFYGLRQRATPQLRNLALDDRNLYFIEEEHRWAAGQHSSLNPPRVHLVRSTGIPIVPAPASCASTSSPAATRSSGDLSTRTDELVEPRPVAIPTTMDGPVHGPMWVDACGDDVDVKMNFCPRAASEADRGTTDLTLGPWSSLQTIAQEAANVELLRIAQLRSRSPATRKSWPWAAAPTTPADTTISTEATRWPGWAPCWRHDEFPYLTVAEMVDFAAGVRVTARHCFMLETLSVHVRPAVSVRGMESAADLGPDEAGIGSGRASGGRRRRASTEKLVTGRGCEVRFPDKMWSELIAKGQIAGDERWIIGEDEGGRITIVRF
ncbi:hypothetical protein VTK26DRAFT_690 [Humicola hyalothermophila]